jgi:uncharacterized DUF497 family protein
MDPLEVLADCTGFDWDEGNADKNWRKHRVTASECEQVFFNQPLVIAKDFEHSKRELRFYALGQTDAGRLLFVVFTIRQKRIRIVSARNMNRNEQKRYQQHEEKNTEL